MSGSELRTARRQRRWTQAHAAKRLGISQPYLALLESGRRSAPPKIAQAAVRVLKLRPTALPLPPQLPPDVDETRLAKQLVSLGYPGFAYMRAAWKRNPAEVLLSALRKANLDPRLTEALPWLLLRYGPELDAAWLVQQARLHNLQNRLGYLANLAKRVAEKRGDAESASYRALASLEGELELSRLAMEDALCQSMLPSSEREWLRRTRTKEAEHWHLLTDLLPEHLQYAT